MEYSFGLISEGVSDFRILRHLTGRYLGNPNFLPIHLFPGNNPNGTQKEKGGWSRVIKFISGEDSKFYETIKEEYDYYIIQIDTDVAEEFGIDKRNKNQKQLYEETVKFLLCKLNREINPQKVIFAIGINDIECWLIPFITHIKKKCEKDINCVGTLNNELKTKNLYINKDDKNSPKAVRAYNYIFGEIKKKEIIKKASEYNYGFSKYLEQIDNLLLNQ